MGGGGGAGGDAAAAAADEAKAEAKVPESIDFLAELAEIAPHFDCRVGSYASWEEARALLLWRAYDCSVNGVSDAVYVRSTHAYYIITHSNHDMHTHRTNIAVSIESSP